MTLNKLNAEHTAAVKAGNLALATQIAQQIFAELDRSAALGVRGGNFRKS